MISGDRLSRDDMNHDGDERYQQFNSHIEAMDHARYMARKWHVKMQCKLVHGKWEVGQRDGDNSTPKLGN
jgi:hypothetical protein